MRLRKDREPRPVETVQHSQPLPPRETEAVGVLQAHQLGRVFARDREQVSHVPVGACSLLVHGLGDSGSSYQEVFDDQALAEESNLLVPDLAGYGRSSRYSQADCTFEARVDRLWKLLDRFNAGQVVVVGHSMGGDLTTLMCASDRDGRIVGYVNVEGDISPHDLFISGAAVAADDRGEFEHWFHDSFVEGKVRKVWAPRRESLHRYYQSLLLCDPRAFLADARELVRRNTTPSGSCESEIGALYCGLSIPRVFCWGTESLSEQARDLLAANALDHRSFDGAGHAVMVDSADEFYPVLRDLAASAVGDAR